MGDYNDYKLPDPCLRLDFGGAEFASIELGEGTGYIRRDIAENGYETLKLYTGKVRDLFEAAYSFAYGLYVRIPLDEKTVEDAQIMTNLVASAHELGIEIDK